MRKTFKTFTFVLMAVILCFCTCITTFASPSIPDATLDFYVNDFANIFSAEDKDILMNNALSLANKSDGIQVVISTVKSLEGDSIENYATTMYNKYGIGKDDMGLLILLSTGDRQIRVEVGKAMEGYINDSKAGRFIDKYAIPHLKQNKFNEGLISLQTAFIKEITDRISSETAPVSSESEPTSAAYFTVLFAILGSLFFIALLIYIIMLISKKIKKRKNLINELNNEIAKLNNENENLKKLHVAEKESLNKTIRNLSQEKEGLKSNLSESEEKLLKLTDRYNRAVKIYPDCDKKIDDMIKAELIEKDKKAASLVDSLISDVIILTASKDIVERLRRVISKYSNLTKSQKQYVTSDVSKLNSLYNSSVKLKEDYERKLEEERLERLTNERKAKASSITKEIMAIISLVGIAKANDLSRLRDAKELYEDLDHETQRYVDNSLISKLDSLISAAKRDKEEEEEEERRRRQASYSSFNSSHRSGGGFSGGGFGGFGGRSGGGGASRGF